MIFIIYRCYRKYNRYRKLVLISKPTFSAFLHMSHTTKAKYTYIMMLFVNVRIIVTVVVAVPTEVPPWSEREVVRGSGIC